jgi:hypothetical protein
MKTKVVKVTATMSTYLKAYVLVPEDATDDELWSFLINDETQSITIAESMHPHHNGHNGDWDWGYIDDADPLTTPDLDFVDELLEERAGI